MSTKIEMKMRMPDRYAADKVLNDEIVAEYLEDDVITQEVEAVFYDTPDWDLYRNNFMLHIRDVNGVSVATLKRGGRDPGAIPTPGLYISRHWVCAAGDIDEAVAGLMDAGAPELLEEIVGGARLGVCCSARYTRRSTMLYMPDGVRVDLSIDEGTLEVDDKSEPILEMEFELLFGDLGALPPLCDNLADKYGLVPELQNKYERALRLLRSR